MVALVRAKDGGLRVYVRERRVHHGLVGVMLVGCGLYLAWADRQDFPWRLVDEVMS